MLSSMNMRQTCLLVLFASRLAGAAEKANVVLIVTDDQGYGEIAAHGNPGIRTPNLDRLHRESVRLTDFHVDPTCSPTRAALLTGRYSTRTGVWHTINGRSLMRTDEQTLAEVFRASGYATAMVGKWHLGDNAPCRPEDQGFDHVVRLLGGGLGNAPDYWENDYFDDTCLVNGEWRKQEGYCTDAWFREATRFVENNRDRPFFLYLATNAPHAPYRVADAYAARYQETGRPEALARFYGMIENIDDNIGAFRARLADLGLARNTLLIFCSDNGSSAGEIMAASSGSFFNAGMRGWKGQPWDGGHRAPCFWHWPDGGLASGRDVPRLSAHIDVLPTLVDLLGLKRPEGPALDGVSLRAALRGDGEDAPPDRALFVHVQRAFVPPKWTESAVLTARWRLVNGAQLYDIQADPGQRSDLAAARPETVAELREKYEAWWRSLQPALQQIVRHTLGGAENPTTLSSHDWLMPGVEPAAWHQKHLLRGDLINGPWAVEVEREGEYEISLYRWPPYLDKPMNMQSARLRIGGIDETMTVAAPDTHARFRVRLPAGPAMLQTWLSRPDGRQHGAYFARVKFLP